MHHPPAVHPLLHVNNPPTGMLSRSLGELEGAVEDSSRRCSWLKSGGNEAGHILRLPVLDVVSVRSLLVSINARPDVCQLPHYRIRLMALMANPCILQGHTASTAQTGRSLAVPLPPGSTLMLPCVLPIAPAHRAQPHRGRPFWLLLYANLTAWPPRLLRSLTFSHNMLLRRHSRQSLS